MEEVKMRKITGTYFMVVFFMLSFCFLLSPLAQEKKETEEVYTIKQGDTLWDISSKFLKNPFLWPRLWQRNPYITNPHWISPGQPIRLSQLGELKKVEPPKLAVEEKPKEVAEEPEVKKVEPPPIIEQKAEVVAQVAPVEEKPPVFPEVRSAGFISDIGYKGIGIILEAREGKTYLDKGDIVYLAFKTSEPILIGNKYTLFRASEAIDPVSQKKVGVKRYNIVGNVQVIDHFGNFYTAKIIEAFDVILRGDMIQPYSKEKMEVEERK